MRVGDSGVGTVKNNHRFSFHHTTTRLTQWKFMNHCPTFAAQPGAQASDSSHVGLQHHGDQLKQAPPISAGKARCQAAHSETRSAASEVQPCKSLMAGKWRWYRNLLNERNEWLISQSYTSSDQREKETWQPCVLTLEFADPTAGWGKSCLHRLIFSIWMKMCRLNKSVPRTVWRENVSCHFFLF